MTLLDRLKAPLPRAWRFVGLAISLASLWLFLSITADIITQGPGTQFDVMVLEWLHSRATPVGYAVFGAISEFGSFWFLTLLTLAVGIVLAVRRQWIVFSVWLTALAGAGLLDAVLKQLIQRPRPEHAGVFLDYPSWSFPSGHAMSSLIAYGMLAYLLGFRGMHDRSRRILMVLGCGTLVAAIGMSRLYLGVHYFSDVIGGYAAGALWLSACVSGLEVASRWKGRAEGLL